MTANTIVAIATPPGRGGVGIIRLSGPLAANIALQLSNKKKFKVRQATFCLFKDREGELIDSGLVIYFKAPHSFTGEDVVELQIHGSPITLDNLLNACLKLGARIAKPGEFSERAFLNDKIDLTQAEAIADLIQASSDSAARSALNSLQGEFSKKIQLLNEEIINLRLFVEAAIDFPEEEIDFLSDGKVEGLLERIINTLHNIRENAQQGVLLREGLSVVIVGRPNAGKSTLINALAGREVAIVTDIAGTTRDVMREHILMDDLPIHLIDTAGIRESEEPVEKEGIRRAWNEVKKADCILVVIDLSDSNPVELNTAIQSVLSSNIPMIEIYNKIDYLNHEAQIIGNKIYLSAKNGQGLDLLKAKIKDLVGFHPVEGQFIARRRHLDALNLAYEYLVHGREQLLSYRAGELLAEDLRLAHQALGEITGEFSSDDLLGRIFSSFCIGK